MANKKKKKRKVFTFSLDVKIIELLTKIANSKNESRSRCLENLIIREYNLLNKEA